MKRLIYDLVGEGGHGLAANCTTTEELSHETAFGLDDVMVLRCLGPAESDWIHRSQVVTKEGILGGRRRILTGGKDSMVFQDTTVSRRHFEAGWGPVDETSLPSFYIQDLGSAGGTYLRLRPREIMELRDGAMILVGKHQFIVISPSRLHELQLPAPACKHAGAGKSAVALEASHNSATISTPLSPGAPGTDDNTENQGFPNMPPASAAARAVALGTEDPNDSISGAGGGGESGLRGRQGQDFPLGRLIQRYLQQPEAPLVSAGESSEQPLLMLQCFAPEGSPMQHRVFAVGVEGASIGRKQSNTVSLSQEKGGEVLGLDSAVSGEHCRIEYHHEKGGFVLVDGGMGGDKPSTNGTWTRLSYIHMTSARQKVERDDEILVGGILRFSVSFETFLMESVVPPREEGAKACDTGGRDGEGAVGMMSDGEGSTPRSKQDKENGPIGREEPMDTS